ncbi:MAG: hypothetical protein AAFR82_02640 [Pseudomonadota bacterium]
MGFENVLGWLQNNTAALVAILAAGVAMVSAYVSRRETQRQRTVQTQNLRHTIDAQSLGWGNACIDALNRAAMFARTRQHQANDAGFFQQRINMMMALQSLLLRGRLLFPERNDSERPPILDALEFAALEVEALTRQGGPTAANSAEFVEECRDLFMVELQAYIDSTRQDVMSARVENRPTLLGNAAHERAKALKTKLKSRRPGINLSDRKETVQ